MCYRNPCASQFALLTVAYACLCLRAGAQSSVNQFWPETEGYYSFNPSLRVGVMASRSNDGDGYNSIKVGSTLNFFAKRFVRPVLSTPDPAKNNLLMFGIGFRYLAGIDQASENRLELDVTPQFKLPLALQGSDRSRIDLRFVEGSPFSWRYRNCLSVQRTFKVHRFVFSPYAQGEFFHSSSTNSWNKLTYQFGSDFPFRKRLVLELYYERDNNVGSVPKYVNGIGATMYLHF